MGDYCERPEEDEKISLMETAIDEINGLRHRNEILQAKVDTMDLFRAMLFAEAPRSGGICAPDVAWNMQRYINNQKTKPEKSGK